MDCFYYAICGNFKNISTNFTNLYEYNVILPPWFLHPASCFLKPDFRFALCAFPVGLLSGFRQSLDSLERGR
jgi:hypothetical protein